MAATLVEGQDYGLDSNGYTKGNKTYIHVKFTDSAFRAIEEYSKIKDKCDRKPCVQFTSNLGTLTIPGQASTEDPKAEHRYQLNLAKVIGDANGSLDCVQQTTSRHGTALSCLGNMQYKICTNANNDVYSDTRKKIAFADNESKKQCAKEIKMSGRFSGKKVKKVIPSNQYNSALNSGKSASSSLHPFSSRFPSSNSSSSSSSLLPSSSSLSSLSQPSFSSSAFSRLPAPHSNTVSPPSGSSAEGQSSSSSASSAFGGLSKSMSSLIVEKNGIAKLRDSQWDHVHRIIKYPIRDRIVHLLAVRDYKKPELMFRLFKDGVKTVDRSNMDDLLKEISVVLKNSLLKLADHAWELFRSDWPLYNKTDIDMAKRNREAAKSKKSSVSPPVATTAASVLSSPAASAVRSSDHSPQHSQKRARASKDTADPTTVPPQKKQRIAHAGSEKRDSEKRLSSSQDHHSSSDSHRSSSHSNRHAPSNNGKLLNNNQLSSSSSRPKTAVIHPYLLPDDLDLDGDQSELQGDQDQKSQTCLGSTSSSQSSASSDSGVGIGSVSPVTSGASNSDKDSPMPDSPGSNCENQGKEGEDDYSSQDYTQEYVSITTCEQWFRYKEVFKKEYEEYMHLHNKVNSVTQRFQRLKERISNAREGSKDYQDLQKQVKEQYQRHKSDAAFLRRKRRVDYLHNKLSHIKTLVIHYDTGMHLGSCS